MYKYSKLTSLQRNALIGAALGAGVGGTGAYLLSDKDSKNKWLNTALGAGIGGMAGGSAGYLFTPTHNITKKIKELKEKVEGYKDKKLPIKAEIKKINEKITKLYKKNPKKFKKLIEKYKQLGKTYPSLAERTLDTGLGVGITAMFLSGIAPEIAIPVIGLNAILSNWASFHGKKMEVREKYNRVIKSTLAQKEYNLLQAREKLLQNLRNLNISPLKKKIKELQFKKSRPDLWAALLAGAAGGLGGYYLSDKDKLTNTLLGAGIAMPTVGALSYMYKG